ncbi:MAG: hypothetical protein AAF649_13440, partial [Verrucomicrobiota bacterium]
MQLQSTTASKIIAHIQDNPLDKDAWRDLTMVAFDQKETDAFRSYHLMADALEQLENQRSNDTIFGPVTDPPRLGTSHRQLIMDCVKDPKSASNLAALARLFLEDAQLPA